MSFIRGICRSKTPLPASSLLLHELLRIPTIINKDSSPSSSSCPPPSHSPPQYPNSLSFTSGISFCYYHDGRPRGPLWRGKKMIGKEALFVISGLKRYKDDEEKLENFIKTHVSRLLKMDMIAVLVELERQDEVTLALKLWNHLSFGFGLIPCRKTFVQLRTGGCQCKPYKEANRECHPCTKIGHDKRASTILRV